MWPSHINAFLFFFNDPPTPEIYTLSLHDALPICRGRGPGGPGEDRRAARHEHDRRGAGDRRYRGRQDVARRARDRKSTRLNSSHSSISYAVFCLKKKKKENKTTRSTLQHDTLITT